MSQNAKENLITQPPTRTLFFFALPMIIGNLFQQFYNMADSIIVGKLVGEDALAALSTILAVLGFFVNPTVLRLLKAPDNIMDDAILYLQIYFVGLLFMFMYNILSANFNALGRSKILFRRQGGFHLSQRSGSRDGDLKPEAAGASGLRQMPLDAFFCVWKFVKN